MSLDNSPKNKVIRQKIASKFIRMLTPTLKSSNLKIILPKNKKLKIYGKSIEISSKLNKYNIFQKISKLDTNNKKENPKSDKNKFRCKSSSELNLLNNFDPLKGLFRKKANYKTQKNISKFSLNQKKYFSTFSSKSFSNQPITPKAQFNKFRKDYQKSLKDIENSRTSKKYLNIWMMGDKKRLSLTYNFKLQRKREIKKIEDKERSNNLKSKINSLGNKSSFINLFQKHQNQNNHFSKNVKSLKNKKRNSLFLKRKSEQNNQLKLNFIKNKKKDQTFYLFQNKPSKKLLRCLTMKINNKNPFFKDIEQYNSLLLEGASKIRKIKEFEN